MSSDLKVPASGILPNIRRIMWGGNSPTAEAVAAAGAPNDSDAAHQKCPSAPLPPNEKAVPRSNDGGGLRTGTPTLIGSARKGKKRSAARKGGSSHGAPPSAKRIRRSGISGSASPPTALSEQSSSDEYDSSSSSSSHLLGANDPQVCSPFLRRTPPEVVGLCLSFLSTSGDRHSLQTTCQLFRTLSNSPKIVSQLNLGGHPESARGALITDEDDPDSAVEKLVFFARMGNLEAIYMLGIIRSYCYDGAHYGIGLLRYAANRGCPRSSYALGLILRDSYREESKRWLTKAAHAGYMPAWQELLPAPEMKARFGDLDAETLRSYLDPASLNRLLGRHYLNSTSARTVHTSHCWNPLCGRWAYKATTNINSWLRSREARQPVPAFMEFLPDLGCGGVACAAGAASLSPASGTATAAAAAGGRGAAAGAAAGGTSSSSAVAAQAPAISSAGRDAWFLRVSRMKMCSSCRRAKYCSKLCQVYDWRSGRHKMECQFL